MLGNMASRGISILYGVLLEATLLGIFAGIRRMMFVPAESPIAILFGLTQVPGVFLVLFDGHVRESLANLLLPGRAVIQSLTFALIIHRFRAPTNKWIAKSP
jgi:hypothetical protein